MKLLAINHISTVAHLHNTDNVTNLDLSEGNHETGHLPVVLTINVSFMLHQQPNNIEMST